VVRFTVAHVGHAMLWRARTVERLAVANVMLRLEVFGDRIRLMKVRESPSAQVLCHDHETLLNVLHGRQRHDLYRLGEGEGHQSLEFGCDMLNGGRGDLNEGALHDRVVGKDGEVGFGDDFEFHPGDLTEHD
jgi:hypothetical protein